jgi:hypothetical protein
MHAQDGQTANGRPGNRISEGRDMKWLELFFGRPVSLRKPCSECGGQAGYRMDDSGKCRRQWRDPVCRMHVSAVYVDCITVAKDAGQNQVGRQRARSLRYIRHLTAFLSAADGQKAFWLFWQMN